MTFWGGSGSGSADPCLWLMVDPDSDPDPGGPKTCGSGSGFGSATLQQSSHSCIKNWLGTSRTPFKCAGFTSWRTDGRFQTFLRLSSKNAPTRFCEGSSKFFISSFFYKKEARIILRVSLFSVCASNSLLLLQQCSIPEALKQQFYRKWILFMVITLSTNCIFEKVFLRRLR
jgi:hypothetical protein